MARRIRSSILPLMLFCTAANARAEGERAASGVRLSWVRSESASSCLSEALLRKDVELRLGYDPFGGEARQWIEGFAQSVADHLEVQLVERDGQGNVIGARRLSEPVGDCVSLSEATSLAVALLIDPNAKLTSPLPPSRPLEERASAGPSVAEASPSRDSVMPPRVLTNPSVAAAPLPCMAPFNSSNHGSVPRRQRDDTNNHSHVGALVGLRGGVFPEIASSYSLEVDLPNMAALPLFPRIGAVYLPEKTIPDARATLGYGLTAGVVEACLANESNPRVMACIGAESGAMHTVVHSPTPLSVGDRFWLAARGEVGARLRIYGPIAADLRILGIVPITRERFRVRIDNQAVLLHSPSAFEPGASLGLGVAF